MPTIDELAPATAASDTDEVLASQNGITRKVTRAQLVSGLQSALAVPAGSLLGRESSGVGGPEPLQIGNNLVVNNGTISAATNYVVSVLPAGTVPAPADLVPMGQGGANTAIPFSQFMAALPNVPGIDASSMIVTPTGASAPATLASLIAGALPIAGGTMTGALALSRNPSSPMQAATKQYVDSATSLSLPIAGGTMGGSLTLSGDPQTSLQAATKQYVDASTAGALPLSGGSLTGALTLAGDPQAPLQATTKHYVDSGLAAALPVSGGAMTGPLSLAADPAGPTQAATKQYVDGQLRTVLPIDGGTLAGPLTLNGDPSAPAQAATKQYVDLRVATTLPTAGGAMSGPLTLAADPTAPLQAATKQYADAASAGALPVSGGTMTGMLTLAAAPTSPLHAATKQYVDGQTASLLPQTGGAMAGPLSMGSNALSGASVAFTGGTIDGVALGPSSPSTVKATTGMFTGTLSVASTINLGTAVAGGANTVIQTANGSNIVLNPQGTGQVAINANASAYSLGFSQPRTWNGPLEQGLLTFNSTWSGTNSSTSPTALFGFFQASVSVASTGGSDIYGIYSALNSSAASTKGNIVGINSEVAITSPTSNGSSKPGATYSAGNFQVDFLSNDNGSATTPVGLATAMSVVMHWGPGATNTGGGSSIEVDIFAESGSSLQDKIGILIANLVGDAVLGSRDNYALCFDGGGGSIGWPALIGVGRKGGKSPLSANGWVMTFTGSGGLGSISGAGGLDFTNFSPTTAFMRGNGFQIDPSGNITGNALISTGSMQRQGMAYATPAAGSTVTIGGGISDYRILGGASLASLIIRLPQSPANGQMVRISTQVGIGALTVADGVGGTSDVQTPPSALTAGSAFAAQWNAATSAWWCSIGA